MGVKAKSKAPPLCNFQLLGRTCIIALSSPFVLAVGRERVEYSVRHGYLLSGWKASQGTQYPSRKRGRILSGLSSTPQQH